MGADIFGREKRGENEGFTKGAGTLERDNRTLYVNYEGAGCYDLPKVCVCVCVKWCGSGLQSSGIPLGNSAPGSV